MKYFLVILFTSFAFVSTHAQKGLPPVCHSDVDVSASLQVEVQACDWKPRGYRFIDGSTLADLRLHYVTLGKPHRGADGKIENAILLLHWTSASGAAMMTDEFIQTLYS